MEEKHEIIAPNFISKPSSMSSPTHAPYKHIAAKVELKGIRLTILTTGRDEILALLTGLPLALSKHRITTRIYFQLQVSYTDYNKFS
ncbi:hypothetical protein [Limosilactobacillus oris]|uniref:hypothetical protein n=1 Tax=Limosilactobacillus oris TaxID=1632 RepID=UPI0024B99CE1|nr:hypothetical protein [Limosilactobacillus oris]